MIPKRFESPSGEGKKISKKTNEVWDESVRSDIEEMNSPEKLKDDYLNKERKSKKKPDLTETEAKRDRHEDTNKIVKTEGSLGVWEED